MNIAIRYDTLYFRRTISMHCTCIVDSLKRLILFRRSIVYRSPEIIITRLSVFSDSRRRRKLGVYPTEIVKNRSLMWWLLRLESSPDYFWSQEWRFCASTVLDRSSSCFRLFGRVLIVERWINASPESCAMIFSIEERERSKARSVKEFLRCRSRIMRRPLRPRKTMTFAS